MQIIKLFTALPHTTQAQVIGKQLLRSGTSVGAQFAEAKRSRSKAEFESKLQSALQELEETNYWLDLLQESGIVKREQLSLLCKETGELTAILVSSINKSKRNV